METIKELDTLLLPILGENKKISSYKTKNLTAPGENYGSIMLAVTADIEDKDGETEELHLVAKLLPPTEFIRKLFNIPVTYKKEVGFYHTVLPTMQDFQRRRSWEEVMDFFPKYYGSRISLDPEVTEVDDDACLLLENIKVRGYDICDRLEGFDLQTAEFLIKDLATFHAVPIAIKLTEPELFEEKIVPYLINHVDKDAFHPDMVLEMIKTVVDATKQNKECAQYAERIERAMETGSRNFVEETFSDGEPFSTLVHSDFWVNNTMLKFVDGKPIGNAIVDFQLIRYGNLAHDLVFFLYSSITNDVLDGNYQKLIDLYYETFIETLKKLNVDSAAFTYERFLEVIDLAAKEVQVYHVLFMLTPIFKDKKKAKALSDINENEIAGSAELSDLYYPKLWATIADFVQKNWL